MLVNGATKVIHSIELTLSLTYMYLSWWNDEMVSFDILYKIFREICKGGLPAVVLRGDLLRKNMDISISQ